MFDDIIKKPKGRMLKTSWTVELKADLKAMHGLNFEEVERRIQFTKDYEKWMDDYQKLIKDDVELCPKSKLQGTWNCEETDLQIFYDEVEEAHVDIYIKPIKPVEFIVLNSVITKTGASFSDV